MGTTSPPPGQEIPPYGVISVGADHPDFEGMVRWFHDDGGVGTGHMHGGTPRREGESTVDTVDLFVDPAPGPCNRVMTMPAADYAALTTAPPDNYAIAGIPLDVDILFGADVNQQCTSGAAADKELPPMRLTLFYNQDTLDRLGINEPDLKILQYDPNGNGWIVHPTISSAAPLGAPDPNWVSTEITEDGIYALGWQLTP